MGLFSFRRPEPTVVSAPLPNSLPVSQVDLTKRYDVYIMMAHEERVFENVRVLGIRKFDGYPGYGIGMPGTYLEVEAEDGTVLLLAAGGIQILCEHGSKANFRVLRRWPDPWES